MAIDTRHDGTTSTGRRSPPPTAHRLAAWLSVARGLAGVRANDIRFPPSADDVQVLRALWRRRLLELLGAGLPVLRHNEGAGERAYACKPHAFSYAGTGEVCRLQFCPFCHAAEAAAAYERFRRVVQRHGRNVGFVVNQLVFRLDLDDLGHDPQTVVRASSSHGADPSAFVDLLDGSLGSIARYAVWPHPTRDGKAVLAARVLAAVPREQADQLLAARRRLRQAQDEIRADRSVIGLINSGSYRVRPSPVSMARAVAHVFHYPADLLTADPDAAAAVLGRLAGRRLSSVRGVFRTSLSVSPRYYPRQFVPTNRKGAGVAVRILSLQPHAEEGALARDFACILGIAPVDTFEQAARAVGMPLYWLGRIDFTIAELVRPKKCSDLYQAVAGRRPKRPGLRHALVYLHAGVGLMALSTWPPLNLDAWPASDQSVVVSGGRVRGRVYTLDEAGHFARRLSAALAAGERKAGDGGGRDDHPQDAQALPSGTSETRLHGPE